MTVSTHVYSASLLGSPNVALRVRGGDLSLDANRSPHVQGSLEIAVPNQATLNALDPRLNKRIQVTATATFAGATQSRVFNLHLREREVRHAAGTVSLTLESDEALMLDYAPLQDDRTPLNYQSSLRAVVNYVLDKVIPGASLNTAISAPDVAVPALTSSRNLIRNPRRVAVWDWQFGVSSGTLDTGMYATGGPAYAPSYFFFGAYGGPATGAYHYYAEGSVSVQGARDYVLSVAVRVPTGKQARVDAVLFDGSGNVVGFATPTVVTGNSGVWQRVKVTMWTQPTTVRIQPRVLAVGSLASGQYVDVTGWRLSLDTGDPNDIMYFDGETTDTDQYLYGWSDAPWSSISERETIVDAATPDSLTWRAGQRALDFILPLVQRFGLRPVCDEQRVWSLRDEYYTAPGSLTVRHGINLIDGSDGISRASGLWYDARVTRYQWTDANGARQERTDAYALTTPYTRLSVLEVDSAYPGPGRSQFAVRRAQGKGREVSATTVADWSTRAEQPVTVVLEGSPTQSGTTTRVDFNLDNDEMTVTTRTTELGVGSIDLLPGTINSLPGTINSL